MTDAELALHQDFRILVVEDDLTLQRVMVMTLSQQGYLVYSADDGQTAIDNAAHYRPDLVILDISLPKKSGVEVASEIAGWSGMQPLVLVVTGDTEPGARAHEAGAVAYLRKPFTIEELEVVVHGMLVG